MGLGTVFEYLPLNGILFAVAGIGIHFAVQEVVFFFHSDVRWFYKSVEAKGSHLNDSPARFDGDLVNNKVQATEQQ